MAEEEPKELYEPSLELFQRPVETPSVPIKSRDKYLCPHCKAEVPVKQACPGCGEEIDWSKI
jgi:predicted amidophosphoribosyltransferase